MKNALQKYSTTGFIIALGIIYGDIGTSPLYTLNAIIAEKQISTELIFGALSCIIWTLTLQTTVKYVILTLRADNKGEGGIFSLFALVRRRHKWLVYPAMIGGAALLADGIITPPITVTSSIESLRQLPVLATLSQGNVILIVIAILSVLFFAQQFGTVSIGKAFGPVMALWFCMLAVFGLVHLFDDWAIFNALNPYYAIKLLVTYPNGFWILGGVFLCTTGAEALYSDLGHCGKKNIRISWSFVKVCLILNYLGQGAWLLHTYDGQVISHTMISNGFNPLVGMMPQWFKFVGILIATAAAIIASQALISGSFTLIAEAIRLNLWPKMRIKYPCEARGQVYLPAICVLLYVGCFGIVIGFQESSKMEAAYGLAITLCMISTSILFANYLVMHRTKSFFVYLYLLVYFGIEFSFLASNLAKFHHGGFIALMVGAVLFGVMYVWLVSKKISNRYTEFVSLSEYVPVLEKLSKDTSIEKFANNAIFMTSSNSVREIEHKIIYSILNRKPKRANIYWFVHVNILDDPYTCEYQVTHIANNVIRVDFRLGFRVQLRINLMFRMVIKELVEKQEINLDNTYNVGKNQILGDSQIIVLEKYLSLDNDLPLVSKIIMRVYFALKAMSLSEEKGFGLDASIVKVEKFPMLLSPKPNLQLKRVGF